MKSIIIIIGTVTYAVKARKLLEKNRIKAKTVKLTEQGASGGCVYGLEIFEKDLYDVASLLRDQNIEYHIYNPG